MLYGIENVIKSIKTVYKNNNGSTLVVSILIIILLSLLGVSLIAVTMSSLDMSVFYSDVNFAYFLSEAAAEEIAKNLDDKVFQIQENAREQATLDIQLMLEDNPISFREADGSLSLATSVPNYNISRLEQEFGNKYLAYFNSELDTEFSDIGSLSKMKEIFNAVNDDGNYVYKDLENDQGRMLLKSASYNTSDSSLSIVVSGIYKGYEKKLNVKFSLLPDTEKIPYRTVEKYILKNSEKYDILKKAVVSEKNIITSGCNVVITGDVLCFGTVPYDGTMQESAPKQNHVYPTKEISDYFDTSFIGKNKIMQNTIYLPEDYINKGFVYYGDSNIHINKSSGNWRVGTLTLPVTKGFICTKGEITIDEDFNFTGIMYAGGNIYVRNNFNLSGSIMSSKNIVFLGNSTITYNESSIDNIINSDVNVNGLFGLLSYETSDEAFKSQRVTTRNIKVIKWNEIK